MGWSPPKKTTVIISLLVAIVGLALGVLGFLGVGSTLLPTISGIDALLMVVGVIIAFIAWLLMFLGVKMTNM